MQYSELSESERLTLLCAAEGGTARVSKKFDGKGRSG